MWVLQIYYLEDHIADYHLWNEITTYFNKLLILTIIKKLKTSRQQVGKRGKSAFYLYFKKILFLLWNSYRLWYASWWDVIRDIHRPAFCGQYLFFFFLPRMAGKETTLFL